MSKVRACKPKNPVLASWKAPTSETPSQKTGRKDHTSLDGDSALRVSAPYSGCRKKQLYKFLYFEQLYAVQRNAIARCEPMELRTIQTRGSRKGCAVRKILNAEAQRVGIDRTVADAHNCLYAILRRANDLASQRGKRSPVR